MTYRRKRLLRPKRVIAGIVTTLLGYVAYLVICAVNAPADDPARIRLRPRVSSSIATRERLDADLRRLDAISHELQRQLLEMGRLRETVGMKQRGGYYTSDEHDQIESLLFRYSACREALWDMVDAARDEQDRFNESDEQVKAVLIGFSAALHLT
ncbi:MAG: hypothetical protein IH892_12120 [Planctomycetes bacterium]|nr:hypothetical protein [Planctomycetota bacterium]